MLSTGPIDAGPVLHEVHKLQLGLRFVWLCVRLLETYWFYQHYKSDTGRLPDNPSSPIPPLFGKIKKCKFLILTFYALFLCLFVWCLPSQSLSHIKSPNFWSLLRIGWQFSDFLIFRLLFRVRTRTINKLNWNKKCTILSLAAVKYSNL